MDDEIRAAERTKLTMTENGSDTDISVDVNNALKIFGDESGAETDPLKKIVPEVERAEDRAGSDVIGLYLAAKVYPRDITENSKQYHERSLRQWSEHMSTEGRHPACANKYQVRRFIEKEFSEVGNHPDTVKMKVRAISAMYRWLCRRQEFAHPSNYNPVAAVHEDYPYEAALASDGGDSNAGLIDNLRGETPRIALSELREAIGSINHIRSRAVIVSMLKLGIRANEICNVKLGDIHIDNTELQHYYPEVGSTPELQDPRTGNPYRNAIVIPHHRAGTKSKRTRIIPLDDEARRVLLQYLRLRPDNGRPWLLLTTTRHSQTGPQTIADVWIDEFWSRVPVDRPDRLASHYGRKYFSSFWRKEQDLAREKVQYLRGDRIGGNERTGRSESIDSYLDIYYQDVEGEYRENIYKFNLI